MVAISISFIGVVWT